ncbi:MAG: ABC transporter permease [Eubacterium sp.]|nr:ABC transporter permease [Eubacterium sp.]
MQVFKLFFQIAKKKLPAGLIYVIVFFAVCIPMVKLNSGEKVFEEKKLDIVIFDEDQSTESQSLIDSIAAKNTIIELKNDPQLLLDAMYYESVDYTLTVKKGYAQNLSKTDTADTKEALFETFHLHDSYATAMMEQYLDEYVRLVRAYEKGGNDVASAIRKTEEKIDIETEVTYATFDNGAAKDDSYPEALGYVFRYMPYVLISVLMNVLCPILLAFRKKDQRYRINCSSMKQSSFSVQLFGGTAVLVLGIWLACVIGDAIIYGGFYQGTAWIAVANTLIVALICAITAVLVSSFNPGESVINMITQCIGLGMCFLCGVFVPQSMLGGGVLAAARFLPFYWYERANDILMGETTGTMGDVWICLLIEVGFLVALALVTMLISRQRPTGSRIRKVQPE